MNTTKQEIERGNLTAWILPHGEVVFLAHRPAELFRGYSPAYLVRR